MVNLDNKDQYDRNESHRKYLKDLQGFTNYGAYKSPLQGNYGVFGKGKFLAFVHLDDEEVVVIFNRKKRIIVYKDPVTIRGEKIMGITLEKFKDDIIDTFSTNK